MQPKTKEYGSKYQAPSPIMNKMYGLTERSYNELLQILASIPEIEEALIYGSRARGDFWRASDVDLSIKGKDFTRHTLARLNDKLYESHIPLFFDTHVYANIKNPKFKANVDREGIVLYHKEEFKEQKSSSI